MLLVGLYVTRLHHVVHTLMTKFKIWTKQWIHVSANAGLPNSSSSDIKVSLLAALSQIMVSSYIVNQFSNRPVQKAAKDQRRAYLVHNSKLHQALSKLYGQVFASMTLLQSVKQVLGSVTMKF